MCSTMAIRVRCIVKYIIVIVNDIDRFDCVIGVSGLRQRSIVPLHNEKGHPLVPEGGYEEQQHCRMLSQCCW